MCPRPMRIEDSIIYEDRQTHVYMISEGKGYITRVAKTSTPDKEVSSIRKVKTPCPNCGANSWLSGHCEYCGTEEDDD